MRWRRRKPEPELPDPLLAELAAAIRGAQRAADAAVDKFPDLAYLVADVPRFCDDPACPIVAPHRAH
jgi:hypothetical protein